MPLRTSELHAGTQDFGFHQLEVKALSEEYVFPAWFSNPMIKLRVEPR